MELEHRRNLYGVIVGKQARDLALKIDELDAASRAKSAEIREKAAAVQMLVPRGSTIETFLRLPEDLDIDAKIAAQERELEAVRQADQIRNRAGLAELLLPAFPEGFDALLSKTLEGVAEDAERRVVDQIRAHAMHDRGRTWLSEGLGYIRNDACPFCGQSVKGLPLIAAYRAYFSKAYNALRTEIATPTANRNRPRRPGDRKTHQSDLDDRRPQDTGVPKVESRAHAHLSVLHPRRHPVCWKKGA